MPAKETFFRSPHRSKFESILEQEAFRVALDYALLEMIENQPFPPTVQDGWDSASRLAGACQLISILTSLPLPQQKIPKTQFPNLKSQ